MEDDSPMTDGLEETLKAILTSQKDVQHQVKDLIKRVDTLEDSQRSTSSISSSDQKRKQKKEYRQT